MGFEKKPQETRKREIPFVFCISAVKLAKQQKLTKLAKVGIYIC